MAEKDLETMGCRTLATKRRVARGMMRSVLFILSIAWLDLVDSGC